MKILQISAICLFLTGILSAQSTNLRLYQIMQEKCVSCHGNSAPEAGLDLEGTSGTEVQRAAEVRANIVNQIPVNTSAADLGHKLVSPGRADKSYFFHKINNGLEPLYELGAEAGTPCPKPGSPALTDTEKELFRQWIFFGAPSGGSVADEDLIESFYTEGGLESFPGETLEAPAPGEGFQIKMGPIFLPPGGEIEFFHKWRLEMESDKEVYRLETEIGTFSHHFLVYNFAGNGANGIPEGYRPYANHNNVSLVAAIQEPTDLLLPARTAWRWEDDLILDLNTHYINYDISQIYKAEIYMNVYTQDVGTAVQEMKTELIVKPDIYIPNDGDLIVESQTVNPNYPAGTEIFLWNITGHTHKYGVGYKMWDRESGQADELIYDGSCPGGTPGCPAPVFDYYHIPTRYFDDGFYPLEMTGSEGFRHEARYINDGDSPVWFGPTSDDEMMVMVLMYVEDTTGLEIATTGIFDTEYSLQNVEIAPNPTAGSTFITLPPDAGLCEIELTDITGKVVFKTTGRDNRVEITRDATAKGVYLYRVTAQDGRRASGKVVFR